MLNICNFPELKPNLWAGNIDWFKTPKMFKTKLDRLQNVQQIVVNGSMLTYGEMPQKIREKCNLPVLERDEVGDVLPPYTLSLYFMDREDSLSQFTQDFGYKVEKYGKILPLE